MEAAVRAHPPLMLTQLSPGASTQSLFLGTDHLSCGEEVERTRGGGEGIAVSAYMFRLNRKFLEFMQARGWACSSWDEGGMGKTRAVRAVFSGNSMGPARATWGGL